MTSSPRRELKDQRLYLRVSPRQREVIAEAAGVLDKDVSSFVLDSALLDAQRILADRRMFSLPASRFEAFLAALDRPTAGAKPRLRKLMDTPSILER